MTKKGWIILGGFAAVGAGFCLYFSVKAKKKREEQRIKDALITTVEAIGEVVKKD